MTCQTCHLEIEHDGVLWRPANYSGRPIFCTNGNPHRPIVPLVQIEHMALLAQQSVRAEIAALHYLVACQDAGIAARFDA